MHMCPHFIHTRDCTIYVISCHVAYTSTLFFFSNFTVLLIGMYLSCLASH